MVLVKESPDQALHPTKPKDEDPFEMDRPRGVFEIQLPLRGAYPARKGGDQGGERPTAPRDGGEGMQERESDAGTSGLEGRQKTRREQADFISNGAAVFAPAFLLSAQTEPFPFFSFLLHSVKRLSRCYHMRAF